MAMWKLACTSLVALSTFCSAFGFGFPRHFTSERTISFPSRERRSRLHLKSGADDDHTVKDISKHAFTTSPRAPQAQGVRPKLGPNLSTESVQCFLCAVFIGTATGVAVSCLKEATNTLQTSAYTDYFAVIFNQIPMLATLPASNIVVASVPAFGGLAVALLGKLGGGQPRTFKALVQDESPVPFKAQLFRSFSAVATLGTGNSLGPEGPCVELGTWVARGLNPLFTFASSDLAVACGAAAGVAAGFNAPLAALFFTVEVVQPLQRRGTAGLRKDSIAYVLVSTVFATLTTRQLLDERLSFKVAEYEMQSPLVELPLYLGLGLVSGLIAFAFKWLSAYFAASASDRESLLGRVPREAQPVVAGMLCGSIGLFFPEVLFFGYKTLDSILVDRDTLSGVYLAEICAVKLVLTAFCGSSGLVGGNFAPSLFLGATAGAAYQNLMANSVAGAAAGLVALQLHLGVEPGAWGLLPQLQVASAPSFAMVGAAAVLAGIYNSPLTASLLLFELTRNVDIFLPIMASAGLASLVSPPMSASPPPPTDSPAAGPQLGGNAPEVRGADETTR